MTGSRDGQNRTESGRRVTITREERPAVDADPGVTNNGERVLAFDLQADIELNLRSRRVEQRIQQQGFHKTTTGEWQRPSPEQSLDEHGCGFG
jgi:hypothetical protein